jgi:hypothetical protein
MSSSFSNLGEISRRTRVEGGKVAGGWRTEGGNSLVAAEVDEVVGRLGADVDDHSGELVLL